MKNKRLAGKLILLLLAMANFNRLKGNENIRTIQFYPFSPSDSVRPYT